MYKLHSFDWRLLLLPAFLGIDVSQVIYAPRLFPSVLFCVQKLDGGKAWEQGYIVAYTWLHANCSVCKSQEFISLLLLCTQEQFTYCHYVLADYIDSFDTYANFKDWA